MKLTKLEATDLNLGRPGFPEAILWVLLEILENTFCVNFNKKSVYLLQAEL